MIEFYTDSYILIIYELFSFNSPVPPSAFHEQNAHFIAKLFKQLKKKENENRRLFGSGYYESDYIFKNEDGTLYHPDTLSKEFKKIILNNPDLPQDITLHGLRISCVSISSSIFTW